MNKVTGVGSVKPENYRWKWTMAKLIWAPNKIILEESEETK